MSTQGCAVLESCQQTHKAPKPPQSLINPKSPKHRWICAAGYWFCSEKITF